MSRATRLWLGGAITAAGVLSWALMLAILEPATRLSYERQQAAVRSGDFRRVVDVDDMAQMVLWAKDLRWASLVLALGGMLILVTGVARAVVLLAGVLWLALDIWLDRSEFGTWDTFAVVAGGVGLLLAAIAWAAPRGDPARPPGAAILVYSGVAAAFVPMMFAVTADTGGFQPRGLMALSIAVSLALAATAMLAALTAAPALSARRVAGSVAFALAVAAPSVAGQWWLATQTSSDGSWPVVGTWLPIPVLLTGCVVAVRGWRAPVRDWVGRVGFCIALTALSYVLIWFGIIIGYQAQATILPLTGDRAFFDGYMFAVAAAVAGPALGWVAMLAAQRRAQPT
ncbi:MAG TPA: hypothetical protein VF062_29445 [Candidatus Limnocylindrales bacterium]